MTFDENEPATWLDFHCSSNVVYIHFESRGDSSKDELDAGPLYLLDFFLIEEQNMFPTIILT